MTGPNQESRGVYGTSMELEGQPGKGCAVATLGGLAVTIPAAVGAIEVLGAKNTILVTGALVAITALIVVSNKAGESLTSTSEADDAGSQDDNVVVIEERIKGGSTEAEDPGVSISDRIKGLPKKCGLLDPDFWRIWRTEDVGSTLTPGNNSDSSLIGDKAPRPCMPDGPGSDDDSGPDGAA